MSEFEVGKQITRIRDGQTFTITNVNPKANGFSATTNYASNVSVSSFFYMHDLNEQYVMTDDKTVLPMGNNSDNVLPMQLFVKCECGSSKVGSMKHSDYCPRSQPELK